MKNSTSVGGSQSQGVEGFADRRGEFEPVSGEATPEGDPLVVGMAAEDEMVVVAGHALQLTALDQSLLYLLAANAGRVMSPDEILDHRWGVDPMALCNLVDRPVRNLRAKLQNNWRRPRYITTVPGHGYRFVPTTDEASARYA